MSVGRAYAAVIVALRWPIVIAWIALTVAAVTELAPVSERSSGALGSIVPENSRALRAERAALDAFGFPLFSRTILVRRDPGGISPVEQARWARTAAELTRRGGADGVEGAVPLVNLPPLTSSAPEQGTSALAYLLFSGSVPLEEHAEAARRLAAERFGGGVQVTGVVPAQLAATEIIIDRLPLVELATALLVALVVGLHFRALGAPLAALTVVGVSYLLAVRVIPELAERFGFTAPREVAPMIVVLLFGALTDYTIFFLSRCRTHLAAGEGRVAAARATVRDLAGIVTVAAAIVTGASAALVLADFEFFRAFGPGMAVAITVGWLVVMTLAPALLGIFGPALFWPSSSARPDPGVRRRRRVLGVIARFPLPAAVLVVALLAVGASGLGRLELANPTLRGLPEDAAAQSGYRQLAAGFGPGFAAPGLIVVRGERLDQQPAALRRLQQQLERRPGIAAVFGPADIPAQAPAGALVAPDGRTARLAFTLAGDPLGADAIAALRALRADSEALLRRAGLTGAETLIGGDTALAAETISVAIGDLAIVAPAVVLVVVVVLGLYLRAVVVPLLLVVASALGLAAALGATAWAWEAWLGVDALAYYVPFAVAVLLLALGSDYGVLLVGRIWRAARDQPRREAIADAGAHTARPIAAAGLVLAASFALLALVPLWEFRQFALAMVVGLVLDAFLIRPVLVPALVSLAGRLGAAPGRR